MFACGRDRLTRRRMRIFEKQNIFVSDNRAGFAQARLLPGFGCAAENEISIRDVATSELNSLYEPGKLYFNPGDYLPSADNAYIETVNCERPNSLAHPAGLAEGSRSEGAGASGTPNAGLPALYPPKRSRLTELHPTSGASWTCRVSTFHSLDSRNWRYRHRGVHSDCEASRQAAKKGAHAGIRPPSASSEK